VTGRGPTDEDPVAAARSEVERCRSAAWTDPASLASALDQLASRLSEVGRHDERLTAIDESTAIWRELTAADPETALPGTALPERDSAHAGLAWALENRAYALSDLDRHEEAVDPIVEAVAIRRRLEVSDSVRSESALAGAPLREALDIRRQLAEEDRDAWLPELADLLVTLASALLADRQYDEARAVVREAIEILAPFGERDPDRYAEVLDTALELRDELR
jgi:tetratricopeptide (TPR) repeat protein